MEHRPCLPPLPERQLELASGLVEVVVGRSAGPPGALRRGTSARCHRLTYVGDRLGNVSFRRAQPGAGWTGVDSSTASRGRASGRRVRGGGRRRYAGLSASTLRAGGADAYGASRNTTGRHPTAGSDYAVGPSSGRRRVRASVSQAR